MMGTAGEQSIKAPEKPIQFVEDMTDAQIARAVSCYGRASGRTTSALGSKPTVPSTKR